MCGINGIISRQSNKDVSVLLQQMNNKVIYRGPVDGSFFSPKINNSPIWLIIVIGIIAIDFNKVKSK